MSWFEHGTARIYYKEAGSGDPVLLLPGFSDTIARHNRLRDALARHYRVIAADLPGSGRSGPQPRRYHAGYHEEDAQAFVAFLQERGAVPSHLVGFSDGGEVALVMAAISPRVARTVLTWGAAGAVSDPGGGLAAFFRHVLDDPNPEGQGYREYLIATYGESVTRTTMQSFANVTDAIVAAGGDIMLSRADQITCAVLLIVGQQDFMVSKAQIDALAGHMAKAETIEAASAGHGVHEDRPQWFVETVTDWLARQ